MARFYLCTFGCRCNQADSAGLRDSLCREAHVESGSPGDADLVIVNTCTVTHRSDQQARQAVRKIHRENPHARLVVTGCYAERDPDALAALPGVSAVVGNAAKEQIPELVRSEAALRSHIIRPPLDDGGEYLVLPGIATGTKTRPFVKLQDGCDARCSYCIVPGVRGPGRSARPDDVVAEVRSLVERGYQEIVLTGVHLGTYGRKLAVPASLPGLLRRILAIPALGRMRLSSVEPMRFSREIVQLAAGHPAFAPHFHIPLQSGSDRVLRKMRRPYTAARYFDLLRYVRSALPEAALGTDVLVGFPGETDQDFQETCELVRNAPLTYLHVFPFSARAGTDAWSLPDKVPPAVVAERTRILRELSCARNLEFRRQFEGRVLSAITLAREEAMGDSVVLTGNYIHAQVRGRPVPPNRLIFVRIEKAEPDRTIAAVL